MKQILNSTLMDKTTNTLKSCDCGGTFKPYEGLLGYESYVCDKCQIDINDMETESSIKGKWTVGQYEPTESFKAIKVHSCVCRSDDMGLIAITGPADDLESQKQADLFSAAPELLETLKYCQTWFEKYAPGAGLINGKQAELPMLTSVKKAIAKAEGKA